MSGNYPPGVSGNEPQITGEWPCAECGATLPEVPDCPRCSHGEMRWESLDVGSPTAAEFVCEGCGHTLPDDFETCPDGCPEDPRDDWDAHRDAMAEQAEDR